MTAVSVGPVAGSKIYIGTTATSGVGDTYTEIGETAELGEFGREYSEIKSESIGDRNVKKFKGTRDDGTMQITVNRAAGDAGQAACITAMDSDADYNFKLELNDNEYAGLTTPTTFLFKAKVMSYKTKLGGPNNIAQAVISLGIKSGSITETAAV